MLLNLRQLLYLCTLAETGSYHAAARKLYVTQPTLSIAVKKLEAKLQRPLFIRENKKVTPTEAGKLLLETSKKILALDQNLEKSLKGLSQKENQILKIGTYPIFSSIIMPTLMARFCQSHLHVDLKLHHLHQQELIEALRQKEVDLIISLQETPNMEFMSLPLCQEGVMAVLPAMHPLCSKAVPSKERTFPYLPVPLLAKEVFLIQTKTQQIRHQEDKLLAEYAKCPETREIQSIETAVRLASEGMGVAFCMESYVKVLHTSKPVRYFFTGDKNKYPWLTISCRKEMSKNKNIQDFITLVQKMIKELL